jgi:predicted amino acid-binding ACT domain protein
MEKIHLVITAHSAISKEIGCSTRHLPACDDPVPDESLCPLISGVIQNICDGAGAAILQSQCFQSDRRVALIMEADASAMTIPIESLRSCLELAGEKIGAVIRVQKEDLFRYMHRI